MVHRQIAEKVPASKKKTQERSKVVSAIKIALLNVGKVLFVGFLIGVAFTFKYKSEVDDHYHNLLMVITACSLPILVIYTLLTRRILVINSRVGRKRGTLIAPLLITILKLSFKPLDLV